MNRKNLTKFHIHIIHIFIDKIYVGIVMSHRFLAHLSLRLKGELIQDAFHVYLNKFDIVVTHLFLLYYVKVDLHKLVWSPDTRIHQENSS